MARLATRTVRELILPLRRLPPGYEKALRNPPDPPVKPRPAATLALLREGSGRLEVLLLKRTPRARFIPGAYVFPGGRVERSDASVEVAAPPTSAGSEVLTGRPDSDSQTLHAAAHQVAALRETLEETGILVGGGPRGEGTLSLNGDGREDGILPALRSGTMTFLEALEGLGRPTLPASLPLIGHWVTPVQERYRYDTLFFGVQVPTDCEAVPDGQELVEGLWVTPKEALDRNREGRLPMVFPTLATLEALSPFSDPEEALTALSRREIPRLLPKVEETGEGIRMVL